MPYSDFALLPHSRQAKNMGGWYMREISNYKSQINYKKQITNIWLFRFVICRLKTSKFNNICLA
jgi:hypothetical protein